MRHRPGDWNSFMVFLSCVKRPRQAGWSAGGVSFFGVLTFGLAQHQQNCTMRFHRTAERNTSPMKTHILLASITAFAAAANGLIEKSETPLKIEDLSLAGGDQLAGLLVQDSTRVINAAGALVSVDVLTGTVKQVSSKLSKLTGENPYIRPIKLLATGAPAQTDPAADDSDAEASDAGEKEKPAKPKASKAKPAGIVILVIGTHQP